jgi:hypothetical protein
MDPITTAIVAALADVAKVGVKDAYEGLKAVIRRKWGESAPISKAISALEEDPRSKAQAGVLEEKVDAVKAADDAEVAKALQALIEELKAHDSARHEPVTGTQLNISGGTQTGIIGAGTVNMGSMSFGSSPKT